jgi:hypothetical protein
MGKLNKSESKGLLIFSMLAVLVLAIGVVMNFLNQSTSGRVAPIHGEERIATLSGKSVIWVGAIMLGIVLLLYLSIRKENKPE